MDGPTEDTSDCGCVGFCRAAARADWAKPPGCKMKSKENAVSDKGDAIHSVKNCRPISDAPKDGTLLRLRMDYSGDDYSNALWDTAQFAWTVGFNQFDHTGVDEWQYAGWDWNGDEFEKGQGGVPVGWLPFHD